MCGGFWFMGITLSVKVAGKGCDKRTNRKGCGFGYALAANFCEEVSRVEGESWSTYTCQQREAGTALQTPASEPSRMATLDRGCPWRRRASSVLSDTRYV